jgi:hypothetical protein
MSATRSPVAPGGRGIGPLGRESELGKDPADHPGILNGRDQAHAPPTAPTREHVTLEGAPHEVRPRPIARRAGSLPSPLHVAARARANGTCVHQRGRRALVGHGAGTPASLGGKDAVVQHEIDARARSQGGELFEEFQGLEEEVARAIVPGALELRIVRSKALFCIVPRRTDKGPLCRLPARWA